MKLKILALLVVASLGACKSLDTVNSKEMSNEVQFTRYDSDSKVRYNVYNSASHLRIVMSTNDNAAISKILKGGLTVYFDDSGKKATSTFVKYPIKSGTQVKGMETMPKGNQAPDLGALIAQVPKTKIYSYSGKQQRLELLEGDIELKLYAEGTELFYEILIPFDQISALSKTDLIDLTVGVISGTLEMPKGRGAPDGQGGERSGPPPGGGGRGGGGGPQSGSGGPSMESMSSPIDFWFKVILN